MPNIKIERINHAILEEVSLILMREVKNQDLKFVTVTDTETTSDLSYSKIYYTVMDKNQDLIQKELEKASPFIRTKLAEKIDIRHTPELKFIYDKSISYGEHIDKLLNEIKEKDSN